MDARRSIAVSGDLGSGKSTVAAELSRRLGLAKVSLGDIHRSMARSRGMSELQFNRYSQRDTEVDAAVDGLQRDLASSGRPLIVDSRLGWYFFTDAFKVELKADSLVAARRVLARPASATEGYGSLDAALRGLAERAESERGRFIDTYGVDKAWPGNYDMVCDTTSASPDEVTELIIEVYRRGAGPRPALFVDPGRVRVSDRAAGETDTGAVRVRFAGGRFELISGADRLDAAVRAGARLVPAELSQARAGALSRRPGGRRGCPPGP
jgi:cytidylate kinase